MKNTALILLLALLLALIVPASARDVGNDSVIPDGEVLYRQDFSDAADISECGLVPGDQNSPSGAAYISGGELFITPADTERYYLLLPEFERGSSFTVEFTCRFAEKTSDNAHIAFILTSRGKEPTNVTAFVLRANGDADGFSKPDPEVADAIKSGKSFSVVIPVENGVLHEATLTADGAECTVDRQDVVMIEDGGEGFIVRNATAAVSEVCVTEGIDFTEKVGPLADISYSQLAYDEGQCDSETGECSPDTGDCRTILAITVAAITAAAVLAKHRKTL